MKFTPEQLTIIDFAWKSSNVGYPMTWWIRFKCWLHRQGIREAIYYQLKEKGWFKHES